MAIPLSDKRKLSALAATLSPKCIQTEQSRGEKDEETGGSLSELLSNDYNLVSTFPDAERSESP